MGKMYRSAITMAKVTLVFMNIWVMAVVLVVTLGHWRVFETTDPQYRHDNSHLVVMRELKEEGDPRLMYPPFNMSRPEPVILKPDPPKEEVLVTQAPVPPTPAMTDRVHKLRYYCQQQHPTSKPLEQISQSKLSSILVDEKHKFLYCQIPGVAQNDLRKIMLILTGVVNTTSPSSISGGDVYGKYGKSVKKLSEISDPKVRAKMMKEYYKVIFVRDPMERLLKAYDMKIASKFSTYFHKTFGTQIIKTYRKNAKPEEIKSGNSVKFSEFAQFVIDKEHMGPSQLNEHWLQFYKQCHPCLVPYDFVGKFETVAADLDKVLTKLKVKHLFKGPLLTDTKPISESVLKKQYGSITAQPLNNLHKVYKPDYTLFGYECPKYLHDLMDKAHIVHDY